MAFTKLNSFSKKPADLPDVPSPSLTPDDIRSYWETPLDELLGAQSDLVDGLNGTGWVDNSKLAPKAVGVANLSDEILNQPQTTTEVQMKLVDHDTKLATNTDNINIVLGTGVFGEKYPRLTGETDDALRIARAITDATNNKIGKIKFSTSIIEIYSTITIPTGIKFEGLGWERRSNGIGTVIKRKADVIAFKSTGVSVLNASPNHNQNVEFEGIRFEGGDLASDFMQLYACSLAKFRDCEFYGMTGRQLLLTEVMDSLFENCSFEWGGSVDGTKPAVELTGGDGTWEYTNQIRFINCRWESYRGTALSISGTNTNEIFFDNCKMESTNSNKVHMKISNAVVIELDIQFSSMGSAGNTIPSLIDIQSTVGVTGNLFFEHISGGATLAKFGNINNSSVFDIFAVVYNGDSLITSNYVIECTTVDKMCIRGGIRGSNAGNKRISNVSGPFETEGAFFRSYDIPQLIMQKLGVDDKWFDKVLPDGSYTKKEFSRIKAGVETIFWRIDQFNNINALQKLMAKDGFYLAQLSTAPYAQNGAMYYDTTTNTIKVYLNGVWKTVTTA